MSFFIISLLFFCANQASAQVSFGTPSLFNDEWLFILGDQGNRQETAIDYDDSQWRRLSLPHDWSVEGVMSPHLASCTGYLPGGIGWYRKHFSSSFTPHPSSFFIYFEGVYNRSEVYLNGHLLGSRPNGYASFLYDLTPYLNRDGDNVLAVRVDHSRHADSRWYTGSGIYRDVWMVTAPATHLAQWGSTCRLKSITSSQAMVEVDIETDGAAADNLRAEVVMTDRDGRQVAHATTAIGCPEKKTVTLKVKNPNRWSVDDTYLYNIETRLFSVSQGVRDSKSQDNALQPLDQCTIRAGLRTLQFDANHGFALNGKWMKVKGVCLHHDAGALGTVVPREVWHHRLTELKKIGVNAIRMSHNPQAPVVYDLCDELGLLVMDEASDEWEFPKRKWIEGWNRGKPGFDGSFDFFEEWIDRDVADMVRRDRNHPSVFLWSIGNEVDYPNDPYSHPVLDGDGTDFTQPIYGGYQPKQPNAERIGTIAKRLAQVVRGIDTTRPVTGALAGVVMSNQTAYPEAVDVVGYNYTESRYKQDHERYPQRVIYGSENRHDYAAWRAVTDNEHIFGQFLWTGADYLGESGQWPARGSSAGLLDLASRRKPIGWYRASLWSEEPVVYLGTYPIRSGRAGRSSRRDMGASTYATDTWNYREGQNIRVVCYSNQPDVRLTLNGESVGGEATFDSATNVRYWDIPYQPGTLRAEVSSNASMPQGEGISYYEIRTSSRPYALRVTNEERGMRCVILSIDVTDENGLPVRLADNNITCSIEGNARLLALENGNISDVSYTPPLSAATSRQGYSRRAYLGHLTAYIQLSDSSFGDSGSSDNNIPVRIRFSSPLLQDAEISIE